MGVNDKDIKLDDFKGGSKTSTFPTVTTETTGLTIKEDSIEKSSNLKTTATTESKTDSSHKTVENVDNVGSVGKTRPLSSSRKNVENVDSVVSKNNKTTATTRHTAVTESKNSEYTHFKCITCNAGEFGIGEKGTNKESILQFHKKLGHTINYFNKEDDDS